VLSAPFAPFAEGDIFILENAAKAPAGGLVIGGKLIRARQLPGSARGS
jgi:hypothetical protein